MLKAHDIAGIVEAGTDEAGRGCIAGPVYAAAVILPEDFTDPGLNDSKQLTRSEREKFREYIISHAAAWAVASASPEEIDAINILNASILAMHRALDGLQKRPGHILVDGNRFKPYGDIPFTCFVKGDGLYAQHRFWPRHSGTISCARLPQNGLCTDGNATADIRRKITVRPWRDTVCLPCTGNHSGSCLIRNFSKTSFLKE